MNSIRKKIMIMILIITMVFSQGLSTLTFADATNTLIITGKGVHQEVVILSSDWSTYPLIEKVYSTNNSLNFHKIVKVKGYDLFTLIGSGNLMTDQDYAIKFTCSDGFEFTKKISELTNTYAYPNFTASSQVEIQPMIARYTAVIADYPKNNFAPPVQWTDGPLTENDLDKDFPKLVFGQQFIDDMNMSQWGKKIVKITVGEEITRIDSSQSPYKHISYNEAPYNVDAITSATFTIEGPAVEGYRAISLRQIEGDLKGQRQVTTYEAIGDKRIENTYEGMDVEYLINQYVKAKDNAGNIIFKNKSRQTILTIPIKDAGQYTVAYGVNGVPLVYSETDIGYKIKQYNDNGCFKLVYQQDKDAAKVFSNVAYIYIEEKDAKNIFEHSYVPYNSPQLSDYELIIHGDALKKEVRYTVSEIEAMKELQVIKEYSLSNSEYFWYYNRFKGVTLYELLLKAGLDPNTKNSTPIQFVAADHYNFPPMTLGEIKDASLYGYYEKDALDQGDGQFFGNAVKPLIGNTPVIVAYGFNGYPYVTRPTDAGYNPGLGNDGGPLRVIFGKTSYNDTNGSNQVQFLKEIIIGEGTPVSTGMVDMGLGDSTLSAVNPSGAWNHNQGEYKSYLDIPVLRVTGSDVKEPTTFTLRQLESMTQYAIRDVYTGDGIHEFEGIILWDLISEYVQLKEGVTAPSIRVYSGQNYNQILRSNEQVVKGVLNAQGISKKIILAYAIEGYPLVPNEGSQGYINNNAYGPLRLLIEESKSMWVKWTDCIVVGTGNYEEPLLKDVKTLDVPELMSSEKQANASLKKMWLSFLNHTGKEMVEASVRSMTYDDLGTLWIGTNNGGVSTRSSSGEWHHYKEIETENAGLVKVDTSYSIVQRENGEFWMALGGAETPQGILVRSQGKWRLINTDNSNLPANFVQALELDGEGGLWIGTGNGAVYINEQGVWKVYNKTSGLLASSVNAIAPDHAGGVWLGYYPEIEGTEKTPVYRGGYQYLDQDGKITTYTQFENKSFGAHWIRSISIDSKGGVWVTRSGNYLGQGQGEIDYIDEGIRTTYKALDLFPDIINEDDIRYVLADPKEEGILYIATQRSGLLISKKIGEIDEKVDSNTQFMSRQWDNVYYLDSQFGKVMIGTNGGAGVYVEPKSFSDVTTHWAQKEVNIMTTMGYLQGSQQKFRGDDPITRAEFITLVTRVMDLKNSGSEVVVFKDVKQSDWYYNQINAAVEAGLIKGYSDGEFKPNAPISRQEMSVVIAHLIKDPLTDEQIKSMIMQYKDTIPQWAQMSVGKIASAEMIKGFPDGTFRGYLKATRAEAAVILLRFLRY